MTAPLLVVDLGGTNTRLALADGNRLRQDTIRRFRNEGHAGLGEMLRHYLDGRPVAGACIAVAGPVQGGRAEMTNLPWVIDTATVAEAAGTARVALLNDLQAQGHALDGLAPGDLRCLRPGNPVAGAARLVVGIGTGFNAAPVHAAPGGGLVVAASECGHVTLPVREAEDLALAAAVTGPDGFPAVEDLLSGRGLAALYAHAGGTEAGAGAPRILARLAAGEDAARRAVVAFARHLGMVAGDLALVHLPFGGIYLIGGMARAVAPHLGATFEAAFLDKGRFSDLLARIPVHVVEDDYAALSGAAAYLDAAARRL
jgi:glucokinase